MRTLRGFLVCSLLSALTLLALSSCGGGAGGTFQQDQFSNQGTWVASAGGFGGGPSTWALSLGSSFSADNRTTSKLYSGVSADVASGFLKNTTQNSTDTSIALPATGHSLVVPSTFVILQLNDAAPDLIPPVPMVNTGGRCASLSGSLVFVAVRFKFGGTFDAANTGVYETGTVTQSGSTYTVTHNPFQLDGTALSTTTDSDSCSAGVLTPSNGGLAGLAQNQTMMLMRDGTKSTLAYKQPSAAVDIAALVGGSYDGMLFRDTADGGAASEELHVGFGPGAGSAIDGGSFADLDGAFATHATDITVDFTGQIANGLLTCTVTDVNGLHNPCVAIVTTVNSKFQIALFTLNNTSKQQYYIFLEQM